ncbi:amidohydrolase family protein [Fusobacterium simiae]|uniref:amidohydrolase family protein n=1 Tax=Fusobacterium TaxID=848 RepID=UPI00189792D4|nr:MULTISPECIES: amidohydrolase family protein [Fusobacterium]MDC7955268.1 amidohydrolase family protein [Fusobacterium simiae]
MNNIKIDVFAHILTEEYFIELKKLKADIVNDPIFKFTTDILTDINVRREYQKQFPEVRQLISMININPEDYFDAEKSFELTYNANEELVKVVKENSDLFCGAVAMLPMNNIKGALKIINEQVVNNKELYGVQLFTKALNKSIASEEYLPIFEAISKNNLAIWLHPVFDLNKKDNNIVFSWEYEESQAMLEIIRAGVFEKYPNIKIIIHHAGAMVPFFANRLPVTMPPKQAEQFKLFYVDTAILGNSFALENALDYYCEDRLLFGTDAPIGILPAGATKEVIESIEKMRTTDNVRDKIYRENVKRLLNI